MGVGILVVEGVTTKARRKILRENSNIDGILKETLTANACNADPAESENVGEIEDNRNIKIIE